MLKTTIWRALAPFKPALVAAFELEASLARLWAGAAHRRLFSATWNISPTPEFFDHHLDLYHLWARNRTAWWVERGVFSSLALKRGGRLLEIASGDGFNTAHFYSAIAASIVACDFDPKALALARRKNPAPNVEYRLCDIRYAFPVDPVDNVIWDAAIAHFTPDEIRGIMVKIKTCLSSNSGILSGYTIAKPKIGKNLDQHEYEFADMADLKSFLTPYFRNVTVFETVYHDRRNFYFWASDGCLPFSDRWESWLPAEKGTE